MKIIWVASVDWIISLTLILLFSFRLFAHLAAQQLSGISLDFIYNL